MKVDLTFMDGSYWIAGPSGLERIPDMGMISQLRGTAKALQDELRNLSRELLRLQLGTSVALEKKDE